MPRYIGSCIGSNKLRVYLAYFNYVTNLNYKLSTKTTSTANLKKYNENTNSSLRQSILYIAVN